MLFILLIIFIVLYNYMKRKQIVDTGITFVTNDLVCESWHNLNVPILICSHADSSASSASIYNGTFPLLRNFITTRYNIFYFFYVKKNSIFVKKN